MKSESIVPFFATLAAANPQPRSALEYTSVFELLAAVLLSAQATDLSVNKATRQLFALAPTPQAMLELGVERVSDLIRTIGLFRTKAKNLVQTCRLLLEQHGGEVPHAREALQTLPGVGRKTANVVLNVAFGEPTLAVDTHVFRVSNRTGLAPGRSPLEVEQRLMQRVPALYLEEAHHWLILHGRHVCVARLPRCAICSVRPWCDFGTSTMPVRPKRNQAASLSPPKALRNPGAALRSLKRQLTMAQFEMLVEKVDRLVLRHHELQRTQLLTEQELAAMTADRDGLRARLAAARARVDALLVRLPPGLKNEPGADGAGSGHDGRDGDSGAAIKRNAA